MKESRIKVLELFAGSRSIGKVCDQKGIEVFSTDISDFENIDLPIDILQLNQTDVPFIPSVVWASPPCTGFSVAAIGHHWTGGKGAYIPKTETAKQGIRLIKKTVSIIQHYLLINPDLIWFIENPRGLMRKVPLMNLEGEFDFERTMLSEKFRSTVTYCQYGDNRMKPTDIWTNSKVWDPRKMCKNGSSCHVAAPRGSRTGTQGLKNNFERSKIPVQLCEEVVDVCVKEFESIQFANKHKHIFED